MPFPAKFDLAKLNGANGFTLLGGEYWSYSGFSVASAGDVNGDGFADMIVGAPKAGGDTDDFGASYVVFGKAGRVDASLDLSTLDGSNGFKLSGVGDNDGSGRSVASAGDVNGDGFADLIVGSTWGDAYGYANPGVGYVVFGRPTAFDANLDLSALDGSNGFTLAGAADLDRAGRSVASAGDINGDGFADVIIGASGADPHGSDSGASYVVFGKAKGFIDILNLSALNGTNGFKISGAAADDRSGTSVASAGDVNGDGFADVIIGASGADPHGSASGASYVVFGKAKGFRANLDLSALNGTNGFKLSGAAEGDQSGISIASAGDVNGDGFADLIVGANGADPHGSASGASYVVFGKANGFGANLNLSTLNGSNGFKLSGASAGERSGASVASAGDVNGDGFADLIIGAPTASSHADMSGASYVVFGKAAGFAANLDLSALDGANGFKLDGLAGYDFSGRSAASAGDVNGDGFADLIIGAYGAEGGTGASYVVFGVRPDTAVVRTGTAAGQTLAGGDFNDDLAGLGGDDSLWGHGGKDNLAGGDGSDVLRGGLGNDILAGGTDGDSFVFDSNLDKKKNVDRIIDFSHKHDTILLDDAIFTKLKAGELKAKFFEIGRKPGAKDDYLLYDNKSGALSYDADGSRNKAKAIQFAKLDDDLKLKADDFLVI